MAIEFDQIVDHTGEDDCAACRAQEITSAFLIPAAFSWEMSHNLPRFALAVHGAAGLLATMLEEGIGREEIEDALSRVLDDLEQQIAEDAIMGGPPQGNA